MCSRHRVFCCYLDSDSRDLKDLVLISSRLARACARPYVRGISRGWRAVSNRLSLKLLCPPLHGGRHTLAVYDFAETLTELGLGSVERADGIEPGVECGAEPGRVGT